MSKQKKPAPKSPLNQVRDWLLDPERSYLKGLEFTRMHLHGHPGFVRNMEQGESPERKKQMERALSNLTGTAPAAPGSTTKKSSSK